MREILIGAFVAVGVFGWVLLIVWFQPIEFFRRISKRSFKRNKSPEQPSADVVDLEEHRKRKAS